MHTLSIIMALVMSRYTSSFFYVSVSRSHESGSHPKSWVNSRFRPACHSWMMSDSQLVRQ